MEKMRARVQKALQESVPFLKLLERYFKKRKDQGKLTNTEAHLWTNVSRLKEKLQTKATDKS